MPALTTTCNGTYERHPDGWRYHWGDPVPGATDMTLASHYNLRVVGAVVLVPASLARNEPDLAWCLTVPTPEQGRIDRMRDVDPAIPRDALAIPDAVWREHDRVIGMWADELHPSRILDTEGVARLVALPAATIRQYASRGRMAPPQGYLGGSPWWSVPVIVHWQAVRQRNK